MLTAAESEVMNVVWEYGESAVAEVVERLPRQLAYTTVLTTMRILEDKGYVERSGKRGRALLYRPLVAREAAQGSMSQELARRLFGGSVKSLVLNLVQDKTISAEDLAELRRTIDSLEASL